MSAPTPDPAAIAAYLKAVAETIVGPIVVGVVLNGLLCGIAAMQYSSYYRQNFKDGLWIRLLVPWCALVDVFAFVGALMLLWDLAVTNYGSLDQAYRVPWGIPGFPTITAATNVPVHCFLAYRIKVLAGKSGIYYFYGIVLLALGQGALSIALTICMASAKSAETLLVCGPRAITSLSMTISIDLIVTTLLFIYLSKSRSGFKKTDMLITRILIRAVETAFFVTLFAGLNLVMFLVFSLATYQFIFNIPLGRIYAITLMVTLNSRNRSDYSEDGLSSIAGTFNPTSLSNQVNISVQREVQHDIHMQSFSPSNIKSSTQLDGKVLPLQDSSSEIEMDRKSVV